MLVADDKQRNDIAQGVDQASDDHLNTGAGDQGLMFGYACDETPKLIIQMLDLLRPIYEKATAYGHFGREEPPSSLGSGRIEPLRCGTGRQPASRRSIRATGSHPSSG